MKKVKCNLLKIRKERSLKQTELSEMTGISQKALSEIETGKSKGLSFSTLSKLCEVLKVTPTELIEITSDDAQDETDMLVLVEKPSCSFCNKKENEVKVLIGSKHNTKLHEVFICSDCVSRCNQIIENENKVK